MKRQWIFGGFVLLIVALIASAFIFGDPPDRWNDHTTVRVVQVDGAGTASPGEGDTFIIERDGRGFFPFFPLIPIAVFALVFVAFRTFWGGPRRNGPWPGRPSEEWLDDWHRRQHRETNSADTPSTTT